MTIQRRLTVPAAALFAATSSALCIGLPASATAGGYTDTARVVESRPVYQRVVEPRRECTREVVAVPAPGRVYGPPRHAGAGSLAGPVIGGVAGGLIGSQIGGGSGRTAATIAGAVAGTLIGGQVVHAGQDHGYHLPPAAVERVVEQCRTVQYTRDVFRGYDVTYRHRGRYFTTRMPDDPGRFVQVAVRDDYRGDHRGGGRRRDD